MKTRIISITSLSRNLPVLLLVFSWVSVHAAPETAQRPRPPQGMRLVMAPAVSSGQSVSGNAPSAPQGPTAYRLLYQQAFRNDSARGDFAMTDPAAWQITPPVGQEEPGALALTRQSKYSPAVRSPVNIALIADQRFTDFILELEMKQTGREYGHRDMCLFFGVQDPSHFYYAHIATQADDHAHNIFIVNDAPRTKIAEKTTQGVRWGLEEWHRIRLERTVATGLIRVFFDDMENPIMVARDTRFKSGYIGFGSFDDTGKVTGIKVWGPSSEKQKTEFYKRPQ